VSGYEASCPSCGASLVFSLGSSLLRVCEHCGVAVTRKGANLETYGKLAALIPTASVLKLGAEGDYEGAPPFTLVGRLQIDHGSGTWDEWLMAFRDETWAWLSESQGKFHYMGRARLPPVPRFEDLQPGETVDLGTPGVFVVSEARSGKFVTAQGELPFDVEPGSDLHYVDLSGPGGAFATLDYGTGSEAEALYVGHEVTLAQLGFKDLPTEEERSGKAQAGALSCPQCGGPIEVRAPDRTKRIACPYCGSLLDATKDLAVLKALSSVPIEPLIPLGAKGRLGDAEWTVIGLMERSATFEGVRYPWREYLLYEPSRGFRWLVETKGHWSFVEPAHAGDVKGGSGLSGASYRGMSFKHFQTSRATVDHVLGEFYWAVASGDTTQATDFVSPPHQLSKESDGQELIWSFATHKKPGEIWKAFGLAGQPPRPYGVAPNQPWPHKQQSRSVYSSALLFLGLAFLLFLAFLVIGGRQVHRQAVEIAPGAVPGAPEAAVFVGPFSLDRQGNLQVQVRAPVNNSWLYLDGALIDEQTGNVEAFDIEVSYYHGRDSDGAWSEGGQSSTRYLGSVAPGEYVLRLAPQWQKGKTPGRFEVAVKSRVARLSHAFLAVLAIVAWPAIVGWRHFRFEMQRWSESDHQWVTSEE